MKNSFLATVVVFFAGYPCVLVAESIGLLSPALVSGEAVIGCFVAVGILAVVAGDYGRHSTRSRRSRKATLPETTVAHSPGDYATATWGYQTISA
jgi:carbonic anhydrase/acetyltransferase-like protein (isoleucine patch superfamily)